MARPLWERLAPIAGPIFAALLIASVTMTTLPGGDQSIQDATKWLDTGNHDKIAVLAGYLAAVAGVFFLWFLAALVNRLRRAEGEPDGLSRLVFASGVLFTAMLLVYAAAIAAMGFDASLDDQAVGPDTARFGLLAIAALFVAGTVAALVLVISSTYLNFTTRAFPIWLSWLGVVCAIILLGSIFYIPMLALPLWVIGTSFALWRQSEGMPVRG